MVAAAIVAALAAQSAAPTFAQQLPPRELSVEQGGGPSPEMLERLERRERRMRWLRNSNRNEMPAPANAGLTPEERQRLRRDVHEAARELYPERRRRFRPDDTEQFDWDKRPGSPPNGMPPRNMNRDGWR